MGLNLEVPRLAQAVDTMVLLSSCDFFGTTYPPDSLSMVIINLDW